MTKKQKPLTRAQIKALAAIYILSKRHHGCSAHSRGEVGRVARGDYNSYPLATMKALWRAGLVKPLVPEAVELVGSGECRCGCDRWVITAEGNLRAEELNIKTPEKKQAPKGTTGLAGGDGWWLEDDDPADWWKKNQ